MVNLVETSQTRNFKGNVVDIKREEEKEKYPPQYCIYIKAIDHPEWELQKTWISIPKTTTNTNVPKKSLLGVLIARLSSFGLTADTHQETIMLMKDKTFQWSDELPKVDGEVVVKKDKLLPSQLYK